jgi:hypothetical protein
MGGRTENWGRAGGGGVAYFPQEGVVNLFRRAHFDRFHHSSGGDDDAAESASGLRHGDQVA